LSLSDAESTSPPKPSASCLTTKYQTVFLCQTD
jgi:hypothetical protein